MEREYNLKGLDRIAPWSRKGRLPINFCNPKDKNLTEKERIIASYFHHPMRKCFKRANKVLTWLLRQIPDTVPHFTLHKLNDMKQKLSQAGKYLTKTYNENTRLLMFASDVKQMFTFLNHEGIMEALEWLFREIGKQKQYPSREGMQRSPRKINKNKMTLVVEENEIHWGSGLHEGRRRDKPSGYNDDVVTFDFEMLRRVILMDLKFTHSRVGNDLLKQKLGCPIGGILSSFYANLFCAFQENKLIKSSKDNRAGRIYGIRQIDDLVLWVAYKDNDHESLKEATNILNEIYNTKDTQMLKRLTEKHKRLSAREEVISQSISSKLKNTRTRRGTRIRGEALMLASLEYSEKERIKDEKDTLHKQLTQIKEKLLEEGSSQVYCQGLTIEPEEFNVHDDGLHFDHAFAGYVISGKLDGSSFSCKTLNRNYDTIIEKGQQKISRYPPWESYVNEMIKVAVIMGSLTRMKTQNTYKKDLVQSIWKEFRELTVIGYPEHAIRKALNKLDRKSGWKEIVAFLKGKIKLLYENTGS